MDAGNRDIFCTKVITSYFVKYVYFFFFLSSSSSMSSTASLWRYRGTLSGVNLRAHGSLQFPQIGSYPVSELPLPVFIQMQRRSFTAASTQMSLGGRPALTVAGTGEQSFPSRTSNHSNFRAHRFEKRSSKFVLNQDLP